MKPYESKRLKDYIVALTERELWAVIVEYFQYLEIRAAIVHSPGEHGMDIVASVPENLGIIGRGYNILIQAKKEKLTINNWRKEVLYQLLETPYYRIDHPNFDSALPRRIILIVADVATPQARESINVFNQGHDIKVELIEIDDIILNFSRSGFGRSKLEQITGVGDSGETEEVSPPMVGIDGENNF